MAAAWGTTPMDLEDRLTILWADRYIAWENAKAEKRARG